MFLDPFRGEQQGWRDGRAVWLTLAPLRYRHAQYGVVVIPAEFVTDLASTPRAPFTFWLAGGRGTRSAVLHDMAYQFGYWLKDGSGRVYVRKDEADAVFYESLSADPISGATGWIARLMYGAVRFGGQGIWRAKARTVALNPVWSATGITQVES